MRVSLLTILLSIATLTSGYGQKARVQRFTAPLAGVVQLSAVEDRFGAEVFSLEAPEPDGEDDQLRLLEAKERSAARFPRKQSQVRNKTTAVTPPVVDISYVADTFPGIPPDNDMAISKDNRSVSVMNSSIAVHNATTGQMYYKKTLKQLSSVVNLNNFQFDYRYDPKIIYDPEADKYICVMLNGTDDRNWIVIGFSRSNKPDSTWNFYKFYGNYAFDTTWFDYPSIAITHKEFFLTGNKIKFATSWQAGFRQTLIYQIDKLSGYNGDTSIVYQVWDSIGFNGQNIRNLYPVKGGRNIQGPEQYFLSNRNFDVQNDTIFLVKVPDTIGSSNTNLTVTALVSDLAYGVPPNGRQPDTSVTLATNDGRILGAFAAWDEIQFVSTTVHPGTGNSAVFHGVISNYKTAPSVHGEYYAESDLDLGYPNVTYCATNNGHNASIVSFNYTGPTANPGMGAVSFDGTQHSAMTSIKTGDSSIRQLSGKVQRWGDYMGAQQDWNAVTGTVWVEGIYGRKDHNYGNYIAKLVSPFTNSIPEQGTRTSPSAVYPNPAFAFISMEFTLKENEVLSFTISGISGNKTEEILKQHCEKGRNRIQFNTASLAPGVYMLTAWSAKGNTMMSQRFVKQ